MLPESNTGHLRFTMPDIESFPRWIKILKIIRTCCSTYICKVKIDFFYYICHIQSCETSMILGTKKYIRVQINLERSEDNFKSDLSSTGSSSSESSNEQVNLKRK